MSTITTGLTLEDRYEQAIREARALQQRSVDVQKESRELLSRSRHIVNSGLMLMLVTVAERQRKASSAVRRHQAERLSAQAQALARIHDALDLDQKPLPADRLIRGVCADLSSLRAVPQVSVDVKGEPLEIGYESAMPLSLMTIELVANAFDHAFRPGQRGEIMVDLRRGSGGDAHLTVSDNGRGLPTRFDKGAGFCVVESLAHTLDGDVAYRSVGGTQVRIVFTDAAALAA